MSQCRQEEEASSTTNDDMDTTPLKKYVTIVGEKKDNKWVCSFGCREDAYTGSYSRIRAHLVGLRKGEKTRGIVLCSKISKVDRERLKKEEEEAARAVFGGDLRKRSQYDSQLELPAEKRRAGTNVVNEMFKKMNATEDTDARIARFFYSCGISFNVARSPFWMDAVKAINEAPKGYEAPSSEKIRTTLLDKEKTMIDNQLTGIKRVWPQYGVSIVADGWSNTRSQPLISVLAVCGGKSMFLTAVDSSPDEKNASYIADILLKAIENVGKYNVVQILTDDATNCKAARDIIVDRMPHIFWSGSMPHTLSLLMKDIMKSLHPSFVGVCFRKVKEVIKYLKNHSLVLHIFRKFSSLAVIQLQKTKFGHHYMIIKRLLKLKNSLIDMVSNDEWESIGKGTSKSKLSHDDVKSVILDEHFWDDVKLVLSFTKPIWRMIRFCDSDKPVISEVYQRMEEMVSSVKQALSDHIEISQEVEGLVMRRWESLNFPLHTLAYVLNPYYYSESWLQSYGPGNVRRGKPHADSFVQGVYLDIIRKLASKQDASIIRKQLSDFTCDGGVFAKPEAIEDRESMSPFEWWNLYGVAAPQLYSLAIKVLSQTVSSSCAERALSSYSFIQSVRKNKLNCDRAEPLAYVHFNNRILSRYRKDYEKGYKNWDRNTYEDFLEDDLEMVEDQELNAIEEEES